MQNISKKFELLDTFRFVLEPLHFLEVFSISGKSLEQKSSWSGKFLN